MKRLIALLLVVTAVGAWLLRPPGPGVRLTAGSVTHIVTVALDSARTGAQQVTVDVTDRSGAPDPARLIQLVAVLPTMGYLSPIQIGIPLHSGRFVASEVPLMAAGGWQLLITVPGPAGPDQIPVPITVTG